MVVDGVAYLPARARFRFPCPECKEWKPAGTPMVPIRKPDGAWVHLCYVPCSAYAAGADPNLLPSFSSLTKSGDDDDVAPQLAVAPTTAAALAPPSAPQLGGTADSALVLRETQGALRETEQVSTPLRASASSAPASSTSPAEQPTRAALPRRLSRVLRIPKNVYLSRKKEE